MGAIGAVLADLVWSEERKLKRYCWRGPAPVPADVLIEYAEGGSLLRQLLFNRGLRDSAAATEFLSRRGSLHDPQLLPDLPAAVERIIAALDRNERIGIYVDYDVDGMTAGAVLVETLRALGVEPDVYIPHRLNEGYGLHIAALDRFHRLGVRLVITADCGVSAGPEIASARDELGIDVIVTDHHLVPPELPVAVAIIDPHRPDSRYPFRDLAGVGVAFKLAEALLDARPNSFDRERLLDLVAIGTVADVVPLIGENRALVQRGLDVLRQTPRVGLQALADIAGVRLADIEADRIGYVIAPRLNAAGRIGDPLSEGFPLLLTNDAEEARRLAARLQELNTERQRRTGDALAQARECLAAEPAPGPVILVSGEGYSVGIAGLIAQRLVEEYRRPALVLEMAGEICRGSARSVDGLDIAVALAECQGLLIRYGGHAQAAGLALRAEHLPAFREHLAAVVGRAAPQVLAEPELTYDAELLPGDLGPAVHDTVVRFGPVGHGNPEPLFLSRRLAVVDQRIVGKNHLRLRLSDGRHTWSAIAFGRAEAFGRLGARIDAVHHVITNFWHGTSTLELKLIDFDPVG